MARYIDYLTPMRLSRAYGRMLRKYQNTNNKDVTDNDRKLIIKLIQYEIGCTNNNWITNNIEGKPYAKHTLLYSAIIHKNYTIVKLLLDNGADIKAITEDGHTLLHLAVCHYNHGIVNLILDYAYIKPNNILDINAINKYGNTVLHEVCYHTSQVNNIQMFIRRCLELGADVNIQNNNHKTPLHVALQCTQGHAALLLLSHQDIKVPDSTLLCAIIHDINDPTIIKSIVDKNHNTLNYQDRNGNTALHFSVVRSKNNIKNPALDILIKCGVNPHVENNNKLTALDHAIMHVNNKILVNDLLSNPQFDINFIYSDGKMLLQKYTEQNYSSIIPLLIKKGAALDTTGAITPYWINGFSNIAEVDTVELVKTSHLDQVAKIVDSSIYKSKNYEYSPIYKNQETIILEKIVRNILFESKSVIFSDNSCITVIIKNNKYQLSDIIKKANFAHLEFSPKEINAYANHKVILFMSCFNDNKNADKIRAFNQKPSFELFKTRIQEMGQNSLLELEYGEMLAIHQYSVQGNPLLGLMRDMYHGKVDQIPQYLMTIAIATHGLYKLPETSIPCVIRQQNCYDLKALINNVKYSKITQIQEFISTAYYSNSYASSWYCPVQVIISNARGKNIKAISGYSYEDEYLLPPSTQLEWTGYQKTASGHILTAKGRNILLEKVHNISNVNQWDTAIHKLVLDFSDQKHDFSKKNILVFVHTILNIGVYREIISYEEKNDLIKMILDSNIFGNDNYNDIASYILYKTYSNGFPIKYTDINLHNINYKQELLYHAVITQDSNAAITLLQNDIECNIALPCGTTLLHLAVKYNLPKIIAVLINNGVLNSRDHAGNTPLIDAVQVAEPNEEIITLLITDPNINLDIKNNNYQAALHLAVEHNRPQIVQLLLDAGANINIVDNMDNTALHLAVEHNRPQIAQLLLDAGADVNVINNMDDTALCIAVQCDYFDIAEIISPHDINSYTHQESVSLQGQNNALYTSVT